MPRRRKQLLAAAGAGGLVLAIVVAAVLAGGGSSTHSISVPSAQVPAESTDPHAQDRTQITALALAYQQALNQETRADPCSYLDPQSRARVNTIAKHRYLSPISCASAAGENDISGGVATLYPPGINPATIQFGLPSQQVQCLPYSPPVGLPTSQRGLSWAIAGWAGANGLQVTFVKEDGRWWIDVLLCHG